MRVLSGIQPTGISHLGSYFGAFENWIKLQEDGHDCFFFIANQHAITVPQDGKVLSKNTFELGALLLAIGLDKSTIFVQSDVPGISQLAWVLSSLAPLGQMERMIQFKEKSEKNPSSVNLGLLSYPVLQSADIMFCKAELVPVGIDQAQHLELTRELIKRFNNKYKSLFPEPKTLHTKTKKVVGLDGKSKMSKSYGNYIGLIESDEKIWSKLSQSVTDPSRIKKSDPGNPKICNVYSLHKLLSKEEDIEWAESGCKKASIGCIECKKKLFENVINFIGPIREKFNEFMNKPDVVKEFLNEGSNRANIVSKETLDEVYDLIGFKY